MIARTPRPAVRLDEAFDDPGRVEALVTELQPYWPVQRYVSNTSEYAALSGGGDATRAAAMPVAPVFRRDWAVAGDVLPGVADLLDHGPFVDAARKVFDAEIVCPHTVYANLTWQLPFAQGRGHVDIPAFRGFDRTTIPVTFLTIMGLSGLFEEERVKIATAVAWLYSGSDGGFEYWPNGPDEPPVVHEGAIYNTAIVGDNDFMWHRVRPLGDPADGMVQLSLDSELTSDDGRDWHIDEPDVGEVARFARDALRVSISWKATVYFSEDDRRRHEDHSDDLDGEAVLERFAADLTARDLDPTVPESDPFRNPEFVARLQSAYMHYPA